MISEVVLQNIKDCPGLWKLEAGFLVHTVYDIKLHVNTGEVCSGPTNLVLEDNSDCEDDLVDAAAGFVVNLITNCGV